MNTRQTLLSDVQRNILFTSRNGLGAAERRRLLGSWIRIANGTFIRRGFIDQLNRYDRARAIHIARALHAHKRHPSSWIAGPSALVFAGVPLLNTEKMPITLGVKKGSKQRTFIFPPVDYPDMASVTPVRLRLTHLHCEHERLSTSQMLPVASVFNASYQALTMLPTEDALTAFIMSAQLMARTHRQDRSGSTLRLQVVANKYATVLESLPRGTRGRQRLSDGIELLSQPVDSILEARMHVLLYQAKVSGYITQYPLVIDGQSFFADFAFPERKLILELDGQEKYGTTLETQAMARLKESNRQLLIEKMGWQIFRFTWQHVTESHRLTSWAKIMLR